MYSDRVTDGCVNIANGLKSWNCNDT
uniref:Uncharacterized protein n=1 Tax=Anguilla anguilla TaxID=7936 RepID=A0A0E9QCZ7_ANGAN